MVERFWDELAVPVSPGCALRDAAIPPPKPGQSCGFALRDPCLVFGSSSRLAALRGGGKAPVDVKPSINKTPAVSGAPREPGCPRGWLSPHGDSVAHRVPGLPRHGDSAPGLSPAAQGCLSPTPASPRVPRHPSRGVL